MRSLSTRIFSLLLAFVLCFGMVSVSGTKVSAAEAPTITVTALVTDSMYVQEFEVVTSVEARYTARYGSEVVKGTVAAGTQKLTFNTDSEVNLQVYTTYINDDGKQKNVSVYKTSSNAYWVTVSLVTEDNVVLEKEQIKLSKYNEPEVVYNAPATKDAGEFEYRACHAFK